MYDRTVLNCIVQRVREREGEGEAKGEGERVRWVGVFVQ